MKWVLEELYTNATKPYFRAPHIYLSFPMRYFPGRNSLSDAVFQAAGLRRRRSDLR